MDITISPKFIVDAMFGKLGKFLRLLGFDTEIANQYWEDSRIFELALATDRILITRDLLFYNNAKKQLKSKGLPESRAIYIQSQNIVDELVEIFSIFNMDPDNFLWKKNENIPFKSRCSDCNGVLRSVDKNDINNQIPPNSAHNFEKFWQCQNQDCKKIYWVGRHWKDIKLILQKVSNSMKEEE